MNHPAESASGPRLPRAVEAIRTVLAVALAGTSLAWSADLFRAVGLALLDEQIMSPMLGAGIALVYLTYPARRGSERVRVPWYDALAAAAGLAAGGYLAVAWPDMMDRLIEIPTDALVVSITLYVLCMEGLRRATGYTLFVVVVVASVYALVGHLVPGELQTRRVEPAYLVTYMALDTGALVGFILKVACTIVFTFVFFGQLLVHSGGSEFFNDFALATMGRYRGGSAKIAITASSLFGSVSGIVVSNIVATGVVTIPMMKRNGFPPRLAAAVEAVASTGGQLMPPVMGAVAFIMADFLARPYRDIVIAAIIPSFLYYVALFIQADLEAARRGITRVEEDLIPPLGKVLRSGWVFVLPFAALVYALFWLNWEVQTAAVLASAVVMALGLGLGYRGERMRLRAVYEALRATGTSILDILMIVAGAAFIIGILQVTGLGFAFTLLLVEVGHGNLVLLLLLAAAVSIILGMGMPTLAVYVLLAALIAPSLVEVGIPALAAHMFIFYLGMMSFITPPVAIASFFAANLAGAPPMATGWTSMRFAWTAYLVPFLFVFSPSLLLQSNDVLATVVAVVTATAGVWLASAAMIGYLLYPLGWGRRLGFLVAGILLVLPTEIGLLEGWSDLAGLLLGGGLAYLEWLAVRRRRGDVRADVEAKRPSGGAGEPAPERSHRRA